MPNHPAPPPRSLVSRVTAILSTFLSGDSHSVTEIARLTRLPVSTTHRLTGELASWQLLKRTEDGRYEIGLTLQRLGGDVWSLPALHDRGPLVVTDLCEVTRRRARLGVLRGGRVAYIERQSGTAPATSFSAGAFLPAHATALGKALLAFAPRETVDSVQRHLRAYTEHTLTTPDQLHRALTTVRRTGAATARGELAPGDLAVAAPVFGCGGEIIAALELQAYDRDADVAMSKAALAVAARSLSRELAVDGHRVAHPRLRLLPRPATGPGGAATDGVLTRGSVPPRAVAGT